MKIMKTDILKTLVISSALVSLIPSTAMAREAGDHGFWKSTWNLISPPQANNPVDNDTRERLPFLNMIENPAGFDDGFKPGKFNQWQTVKLDASTGAACGDGSPYEFRVKRSNTSSNMVVFFEGGGLCWDQETCSGGSSALSTGGLGGKLPDQLAFLEGVVVLSSMSTSSIVPNFHPKSEKYTKVYVPYCTQDHHAGNTTNIYDDVDPQNPMVVQHRGMQNQASILTWLKANLEQPSQLFVTGQSAGGMASEALYHPYRLALEPDVGKGYLLNDSGPMMLADQNGDSASNPSGPLHKRAIEAFNLDPYFTWLESESNLVARDNIGSLSSALSDLWPDDRFGLASYQEDRIFSGFSYNSDHASIYNEPSLESRTEVRRELRMMEVDEKVTQLNQLSNFGYFLPGARDLLGSHVITIPYLYGTQNEDTGDNIREFYYDLLSGSGSVMAQQEYDVALDIGRYNDLGNLLYRTFVGDSDGDINLSE